jgi:hypothetical protein
LPPADAATHHEYRANALGFVPVPACHMSAPRFIERQRGPDQLCIKKSLTVLGHPRRRATLRRKGKKCGVEYPFQEPKLKRAAAAPI